MSSVNDKTTKAILSENLRRLMDEQDQSFRDIAEKTENSVMTIHAIVRGKSLPRAGLLTRLADAFGVSVGDLLTPVKNSVQV